MIKYPILKNDATIGVTAPSSGVPAELHHLLEGAKEQMEKKGYSLEVGETAWTQSKSKSASAKKRAAELMHMMTNNEIDAVIPPWGGELLVEILDYIDFDQLKPKWILGYSDTSLLLMAITLKTGIATAHGTNLVDLRGEYSDKTTAKWEDVLSTSKRESIVQYSSEKYQKEWDFENPTPQIFDLTETTEWKAIGGKSVSGRLLGGCVDTVRHLIGTPFGEVKSFQKEYLNEEPILWYFENCDLATPDLRRSLVQMKLAGWFDHCSGIMFGRSAANTPVDGYTAEDIYEELAEELQIPIIYDIDCGHVPPQVTLVNGAFAEVEVNDGKGVVTQYFN
ncbi:LD-carboxypeptidase [Halalkalibacillus sediminis]|uniref:LD-carboxypeptidase n=1 Tax=Halalkalibacillus sediminis TaxID=2018042 RepID=A0A2I0QRA1_9BACI|nr:S66 peptidase family protein [Halalkalibacillus sediminis]PKR76849.1 LD-carboxypeptidase [Halalkalibacillus sediminis]